MHNVEVKPLVGESTGNERTPTAIQWFDLLVRALSTVVWPGLVLAFLLMFREQIAELIRRIKGAQWGDAGLLFADRVEAAEVKANIEPTPDSTAAMESAPAVVAGQDPRGVILAAWLQVERALLQLIEARGLAEGYSRIEKRPLTAIRLVQRASLLDQRYVALFDELRMLRNEAAHAAEFSPPLDAVVRYTQLAGELVAELRRKASGTAAG